VNEVVFHLYSFTRFALFERTVFLIAGKSGPNLQAGKWTVSIQVGLPLALQKYTEEYASGKAAEPGSTIFCH